LKYLCNYLFSDQISALKEENLKVVEIFILHSVSTVSKPELQIKKEASEISLHLKAIIKPEDYTFDDTTISICYDIGIFMGELIISIDKKIFWELEIAFGSM
jgi:hypothetical protein